MIERLPVCADDSDDTITMGQFIDKINEVIEAVNALTTEPTTGPLFRDAFVVEEHDGPIGRVSVPEAEPQEQARHLTFEEALRNYRAASYRYGYERGHDAIDEECVVMWEKKRAGAEGDLIAAAKEWMFSFGAHNHDTTHGERSVYIACDEASETRHALAAPCLYDQPFSFTQADVEFLQAWSEDADDELSREGRQMFRSLADRIQALLPPELVSCRNEESP